MSALFIIFVSLTTTLFSEKVHISNKCISGLMPNLIKKILDGLYYAMYWIDIVLFHWYDKYLPMLRSRRIRRNLLFLDRFWKFQWVLGRRHYFTYWQSNLNLCILLSLKPYLFSQWSLLIGFKRCFFWISCQQLKPLRRTKIRQSSI